MHKLPQFDLSRHEANLLFRESYPSRNGSTWPWWSIKERKGNSDLWTNDCENNTIPLSLMALLQTEHRSENESIHTLRMSANTVLTYEHDQGGKYELSRQNSEYNGGSIIECRQQRSDYSEPSKLPNSFLRLRSKIVNPFAVIVRQTLLPRANAFFSSRKMKRKEREIRNSPRYERSFLADNIVKWNELGEGAFTTKSIPKRKIFSTTRQSQRVVREGVRTWAEKTFAPIVCHQNIKAIAPQSKRSATAYYMSRRGLTRAFKSRSCRRRRRRRFGTFHQVIGKLFRTWSHRVCLRVRQPTLVFVGIGHYWLLLARINCTDMEMSVVEIFVS